MSIPRSKGFKKRGVAHELSKIDSTFAFFASLTIAEISCISNVLEPGDSKKINFVLSLI